MTPRKLRRKKTTPNNNNHKVTEFFDRIKGEITGLDQETFMRRILTKLSINPRLSNLWFTLGLLLSESEKYELANLVFDKVVILNPDHRKLWTSKANVLCQLGRHDEASECYKKSLESFTGQLDGFNNLLELQEEIKENREQLGLEDFDDKAIEFLTSNILDLDTFILELESLSNPQNSQEADEVAESLSLKLDELENIGKPKGKFLSSLFGSKKD
jgi:tetratricopeptide (TPR) repeat protein